MQNIIDYIRSMGRNCYLDGGKLYMEKEHQTANGAVYTLTHEIKTKGQAISLLMDD